MTPAYSQSSFSVWADVMLFHLPAAASILLSDLGSSSLSALLLQSLSKLESLTMPITIAACHSGTFPTLFLLTAPCATTAQTLVPQNQPSLSLMQKLS